MMSAFLSFLLLMVVPAGFLGSVDIQMTEEWNVGCSCIDQSGRLLLGCKRWNSDLGVNEVIIVSAGDDVDTIRVDDERIVSISSICPTQDGGFVVTCPEAFRSQITAVACLSQSGAVEWFTPTGLEFQAYLGNSNACGEFPGGGYVMGGNVYLDYGQESYRILIFDREGFIQHQIEGGAGEEVDAVLVGEDGFLVSGEMPGSDQTQAFARRFSMEGDLIWELRCDPGMFAGFDCAAAVDDGYLMGGTVSPCDGPMSGLLVRADASGNEIWRSTVQPDSGYQQVYILSVMQYAEDSLLAGGFCVADNAPRNTDDALIVLLDSEGTELEREILEIPGQNHEEFFGLYQNAEGEVLIYCRCWGEEYDNKRYFDVEL